MHADPAFGEEGDAVSLAAGTRERKCWAATHMEGRGCSYCSCLLPGFCLLLCPCSHSNCPGHLETPVETFRSRRFPPSGFATGHATFPAGMAISMQLPGSVQLPREHQLGLETFSGFFLNGVAVAWLVSHSLSKLSALLQEFEAVQTNSLGRLS